MLCPFADGRVWYLPGSARGVVRAEWSHVDVKKLAVLVGVALVLFFLISSPTQSANVVKEILGSLGDAAESVISFIRSLFA